MRFNIIEIPYLIQHIYIIFYKKIFKVNYFWVDHFINFIYFAITGAIGAINFLFIKFV